MGAIKVEDNEKVVIHCTRDLSRLIKRLNSLERGKRYHIIIELDNKIGASWSITGMGKIERGLRQSNGEHVG